MHVRRMNRWRTTTGLALCATAAIGVGASTASAAEGKVDLCHATSSGTNPYSLQSPSASSVVSPAGHGSHPNDVIPPIPSLGYPGQNWEAGADTLVGAECFALEITKTGDAQAVLGDSIEYDITVKNIGFLTIPYANINVTDPGATLIPPTDKTALLPGASRIWTATRTATAADCGGDLINTATVNFTGDNMEKSDQWATSISCPGDLSITKTGPKEIAPGDVVDYTIVVKNNGTQPVPTTVIKVTDPGATLTPPGSMPDALAVGETLTWTAKKTPTDTGCGVEVANTATVAFADGSGWTEAAASNNSSTWKSLIVCPVDLTIKKTGDVEILPGGVIKYSIAVTNNGKYDIPIGSVEVSDAAADSGSLMPADPDLKVLAANGGTAIWTATQTAVESEEICNTKISNTATVGLKVTEGFTEPDATNNSSTFLTQVICPLKVSIAKNATNGPLEPGQVATYDVIVTNTGDFTVPFDQIVVSDPGADLTAPKDTDPLAPGKTRTWTATRKVPVDQACGSQVENTAGVTLGKPDTIAAVADDAVAEPQTATAFTSIICPVSVSIAKSTAQASVTPGGTVAYDVTVTNPSPYPVPFSSIVITDEGATLTPPADTSALAPGETRTWTATKAVASDAALCGTGVTNTATAVLGQLPEGLKSTLEGPVSATATPVTVAGGICIPVTPAVVQAFRPAAGPTLTVAKTGPARALAGGRVAYRITVTNTGGTDATGVVLRDQPPKAFALVAVPSGGRLQGTNVLWDIGTVGVGQSVTKTVRFTARRTASGRKCNVALVSATGLESVRARACTVVVAAKRPVTPVTG